MMPEAQTGTVGQNRDYASPMPQQLRRQIEAADQLRQDMDNPPAQPAGNTQPELPAAATVPAEPAQPAGEEQTWEQRFRSLTGRYEQAQSTNKALTDRMGELENALASLQARGVQAAPETPEAPPVRPQLVTEEERKEYGEELLTVVGKRAKEEYFPEFDELSRRLKRLEGQMQGVGTVVERQQTGTVYQQLETIPNWKEVNRSPEFKQWLQRPDLYSGRKRQDMLSEAFARHEGNRVLAFFQGFLSEAAGTPSTPPSPGSSAPPLANPVANGPGNGSGRPSLEDFAAPGRARSAPQPLPPDKPVYTTAWIAKFMADKRSGKYRGREADADAIERDIFQAQHEGRITA